MVVRMMTRWMAVLAMTKAIGSDQQVPIFRIAPLSSEVSGVNVRFAGAVPGIEKVVIVTENTDYGIPAAEDTTAGLAEIGIDAETFGVDIGTQDFALILLVSLWLMRSLAWWFPERAERLAGWQTHLTAGIALLDPGEGAGRWE